MLSQFAMTTELGSQGTILNTKLAAFLFSLFEAGSREGRVRPGDVISIDEDERTAGFRGEGMSRSTSTVFP